MKPSTETGANVSPTASNSAPAIRHPIPTRKVFRLPHRGISRPMIRAVAIIAMATVANSKLKLSCDNPCLPIISQGAVRKRQKAAHPRAVTERVQPEV